MSFEFKVYVKDGREFFRWKSDTPFIMTTQEITKDFELSQSLLDMLDLNMDDFYDITGRMGKEIQKLYEPDEEHNVAFLRDSFDKLAKKHIFFEFLRIDWYERLDKFVKGEFKSPSRSMYHKDITHIPSQLLTWQSEIKNMIEKALDVFSSDKPVQQKMACLYERQLHTETFLFETIDTKFERINESTFTEILRPKSMRDIVDFLLRAIIRQELTFKNCRSCGRYFPNTVHGNSEYCDRIFQGTGKTCKEIGSVKVYQAKINENPEFKAYNRAYKSHFARIKYKRMTKEQFKVWSELAREMRDKVTNGEMDLEQYEDWLKR